MPGTKQLNAAERQAIRKATTALTDIMQTARDSGLIIEFSKVNGHSGNLSIPGKPRSNGFMIALNLVNIFANVDGNIRSTNVSQMAKKVEDRTAIRLGFMPARECACK